MMKPNPNSVSRRLRVVVVVVSALLLIGLAVFLLLFIRRDENENEESGSRPSDGDDNGTTTPEPVTPPDGTPPDADTDADPNDQKETATDDNLWARFKTWVGENGLLFYGIGGLVVLGPPLVYLSYILRQKFFNSGGVLLADTEEAKRLGTFEEEDKVFIDALGPKKARGFLSRLKREGERGMSQLHDRLLYEYDTEVQNGGPKSKEVWGKIRMIEISRGGDADSQSRLGRHVSGAERK